MEWFFPRVTASKLLKSCDIQKNTPIIISELIPRSGRLILLKLANILPSNMENSLGSIITCIKFESPPNAAPKTNPDNTTENTSPELSLNIKRKIPADANIITASVIRNSVCPIIVSVAPAPRKQIMRVCINTYRLSNPIMLGVRM